MRREHFVSLPRGLRRFPPCCTAWGNPLIVTPNTSTQVDLALGLPDMNGDEVARQLQGGPHRDASQRLCMPGTRAPERRGLPLNL